ncbi:MAG: FHA domain-containing protein [Syntrophobacterales bacterium]
MRSSENRKKPRIRQTFQVRFLKEGLDLSFEGRTVNLSQKGAFIKTKHYRFCQPGEPAFFTFFFPPDFTGQDKTVGLQGSAVIARIDQENEGIGVEFIKNLNQFEPVRVSDVAGKIRYKTLAYYLSALEDLPLPEFISKYPNGFLVERSERFFDNNVIFQFITDVAEDQYVLEQLKNGRVRAAVLSARIMEIAKRKNLNEADMVTIGRSPDNDIVLYNKMVSRKHAYLNLTAKGEACYLVDLGSTNGTFLNGNQIKSHERYQLADADEISIGPETKVLYFSAKAFHTFLSELK